eukprot:m.243004 g.243004  ORF g.243004 m.243004 type:complete len:154 (+) comp17139_c0_seq9:1012-1473(+)
MEELATIHEHTTIASFVIPFCYTKCFTDVLWIKTADSSQIPVGCHTVLLGHDATSEEVFVGTPLQYYIRENMYRPAETLQDTRSFSLHVANAQLDGSFVDCSCKVFTRYVEQPDQRPIALDFCLDAFGATNPFKVAQGEGQGQGEGGRKRRWN